MTPRSNCERRPGQHIPDDTRTSETGQATIFLIALVALAFVLTAFFVDVGRELNSHGRSLEVAAQAARAAADQVSQESLRIGDPHALQIDPAAARTAGQAWLAEAGASGTVTVSRDLTRVTVTATVPCPATLTAAFGFRDLSKKATATAVILYGVAGGPAQPITAHETPKPGGTSGGAPALATGSFWDLRPETLRQAGMVQAAPTAGIGGRDA